MRDSSGAAIRGLLLLLAACLAPACSRGHNGPPHLFALLAPADGATGVAATPTYVWTASFRADSYVLQIATDPGFGALLLDLGGLPGPSATPAAPLAVGTPYYWRVWAVNAAGRTPASPGSFTTAPVAAFTVSPASLSFSATEGGASPMDQDVDLTDTGDLGTPVSWTAVSDQPWLTVAPPSGVSLPAQVTTLTVHLDPVFQTGIWTGPTGTAGAPAPREDHDAVWTGTSMILWGGEVNGTWLNTGGLFDPGTNAWTGSTSTLNVPSVRTLHTAVWTGSEMIVWGGSTGTQIAPLSTYYNEGHRYDPGADTWRGQISTAGAPSGRSLHTAVWTGTRMIVWGGYDGTNLVNTGGLYDPATNTWTGATSLVDAPAPRLHHVAVWTGTEMLVWGGQVGVANVVTGGRYDPVTDTWTPMSSANAPAARQAAGAVWTGREMVVWGGSTGTSINTGGRYNAALDAWVAATPLAGAPTARQSLSAVWTGTHMVVSHGASTSAGFFDTGAYYRPPIPAIGPHAATITITATGPGGSSVHTVPVTVTITP